MKKEKLKSFLTFLFGTLMILNFQSCQDKDLPGPDEELPEIPELTEATDLDGNVYPVIRIGDQYWMQENLKVTRFADGTPIDYIPKPLDWGNQEEAAYCWYANNSENKDSYGALYNRAAAHSGNLCPTGWHVPTKKDFQYLADYALSLGGYVGNSLREEGYDHWEFSMQQPIHVIADNKTRFSARGGGMRTQEGEFKDLRKHGYWWHSEEHLHYTTWARRLDHDTEHFLLLGDTEDYGFSVRCVKSE
jgi:uncharacterized protein (TIGR02145 family)